MAASTIPPWKRVNVRANIKELCAEYFNWALQDFQLEILEAMFEGGYLAVNVPTDHSKSTMGTFLYPLLSLIDNPNESHIICGANINDSKRRVKMLELELETNKPLLQKFPWIGKPEDKEGRVWSTIQFNVVGRTINKPNPSVLAAAIGSGDIKGRRGKLIMDDIEGLDARYSPIKREQTYEWVKTEAWRCYEDKRESDRPLLCLLGTPFDIDCQPGGTQVQMASGAIKPIEDIRPGDSVLSLNQDWRFQSDEVVAAVHTGSKEVFQVGLQYRQTLKATARHRVFTFDGWKRVEELRTGDYLTLPRNLPEGKQTTISLDDAVLLAAWIAEGDKRSASFSFTNGNSTLVAAVRAIAERRGWPMRTTGIHHRLSALGKHKGDTPNNLLRRHGYKAALGQGWYSSVVTTQSIRLPEAVMMACNDVVRCFLSVLFCCDGIVNRRHGSVTYCSTSENLVRDVQRLLWRFHIQSYVHSQSKSTSGNKKSNYPMWTVTVADKTSVARFVESIGIIGKEEALSYVLEAANRRGLSNSRIGNFPPGWAARFDCPNQFKRNGQHVLRGKQDCGWRHDKVERAAVLANDAKLLAMARGDAGWYKVESLSPIGILDTYDLQTKVLHNFLADNVVVHNSLYFKVEQEGWKVIRYPVYRDNSHLFNVKSDGSPSKHPVPNYLWPDKADKVERARKRLKKWQFSIAYLMDPTGGDETLMSAQEISQATQESAFDSDQFTGFVALDPASGSENRRADYAGITVLKLNWAYGEELPIVEVQEAHAFTQGLFEQVHFCADLASRYGYPVIYETNSQQGGTYQSSFQHLHPEVDLLRHYTTRSNKFDTSMGLSVIKTLVSKRRLHVPEFQLESDGIQSLIQELRDLKPPFTKHDHICASIWFAVRYAYERARHQKLAPIQSNYLQPYRNPLNPAFQIGFTGAVPTEAERVFQSDIQKEVDRFRNQLNGRRTTGAV